MKRTLQWLRKVVKIASLWKYDIIKPRCMEDFNSSSNSSLIQITRIVREISYNWSASGSRMRKGLIEYKISVNFHDVARGRMWPSRRRKTHHKHFRVEQNLCSTLIMDFILLFAYLTLPTPPLIPTESSAFILVVWFKQIEIELWSGTLKDQHINMEPVK